MFVEAANVSKESHVEPHCDAALKHAAVCVAVVMGGHPGGLIQVSHQVRVIREFLYTGVIVNSIQYVLLGKR